MLAQSVEQRKTAECLHTAVFPLRPLLPVSSRQGVGSVWETLLEYHTCSTRPRKSRWTSHGGSLSTPWPFLCRLSSRRASAASTEAKGIIPFPCNIFTTFCCIRGSESDFDAGWRILGPPEENCPTGRICGKYGRSVGVPQAVLTRLLLTIWYIEYRGVGEILTPRR